jgi:hypothetical protein
MVGPVRGGIEGSLFGASGPMGHQPRLAHSAHSWFESPIVIPPQFTHLPSQSKEFCCGKMQRSKRSCVLFCCVLVFVLCSQRGSSRVYLLNVSLMYTCVESAHGVGEGALGQRT